MRRLALVALLLAIPSMVQAKTLEDLLVEKGVITTSEARGTNGSESKVYWNDGTRLEFPDNGFTTKINTQIQASYKYVDTDDGFKRNKIGINDFSSFDVDRARLILSGTALNEEFKYKLSSEFATDKYNEDSTASMKDAYIQWEPCEGMGYRLGQFKTGISRQFNTEYYALQIPVRSVVSDYNSMSRQGGVRAFYTDLDDTFAVYASMYNGESDSEMGGIFSTEDHSGQDTRHAFDASARVNVLGHMDPFVEGDIDQTQDLALNVGTTYSYSSARNAWDAGDPLSAGEINRLSADVNLKYQGFSTNVEFFWSDSDYNTGRNERPVGFYAQAGYFLTNDFEVAGRYSLMDCDHDGVGSCYFYAAGSDVSDLNEAALSLNYYFWKHSIKAQLAYIFLNRGVPSEGREATNYNSEENTNVFMFQVSAYL